MTHSRQYAARRRAPGGGTLLTAAVAALCLAARPTAYAAPAPTFDLDFVPADAVMVVSVRVGAVWANPVVKAACEKLGDDMPLPLREAEKQYGVKAGDIDRFTLIQTSKREHGGDSVVISTLKPYDRKALAAAVAPDAAEEMVGDRAFYHAKERPSLVCLDGRTFAVGSADALQAYMKRHAAPKERVLTAALKDGETHSAFVALDVAAFARALPPPKNVPPDAAPLLPLLMTQTGLLTADLDDNRRAEARLTFANEVDAGAGAGAAEAGLDLLRGEFAEWLKVLDKGRGARRPPGLTIWPSLYGEWIVLDKDKDARKLLGPLTDVEAALKSAHAERTGATVKATMKVSLDADKAAEALADGARVFDRTVRRMRVANGLRELTLGSINCADAHNGKMLPPAVLDKAGKPLLSWRVLILLYIGEEDLYKQFKLDEPWDSDRNKKLLEKMPALFAPPESAAFKKHETFFQALAGKGTLFDGKQQFFPASISDGTSQTIMYAEAAKSVPWTKPEDIPFDGGPLLPKLGGLSKNGFMVGLCDGSVRFFPLTMKEDNLHAWITPAGGEVVEDPDQ